jgi:hypothetical protein
MTTQSDLEAKRDALKSARASGVSRVTYDGRSIEYRSIAELERALDAVEADIAKLAGTTRTRGVYVRPVKGW